MSEDPKPAGPVGARPASLAEEQASQQARRPSRERPSQTAPAMPIFRN